MALHAAYTKAKVWTTGLGTGIELKGMIDRFFGITGASLRK